MHSKCVFRVVDDDSKSPNKIVPDIFDFFLYKFARGFPVYHSPNTTLRPPLCLVCDVIWAPLECNTTSESPNDSFREMRKF